MQCTQKPGWISGTGVRDSFEPPRDCWTLNLSPLEEQPVLLTAEPSLQEGGEGGGCGAGKQASTRTCSLEF